MQKKRWYVTMINKADRTDKVHTSTWAETWTEAMTNVNREFAAHPDVWGGWTYTIQES